MQIRIKPSIRSGSLIALSAMLVMVVPAVGEGRPGSLESELAIEQGILDGVTRRHARKKEELEMYQGYQQVLAEIEKLQEELEAAKRKLVDLEEKKTLAGDEVSAVQLAFEAYRNQYRKAERESAKGEILDLSSTKGEEYKDCEVLGISPLHLRIRRPTGSEGIPFQELPADIQDRFQFEADEAARYAAAMAKSDAARAKVYREWKRARAEESAQESSGGKLEDQLVKARKLVTRAHDEQAKYRKESDAWRERAARYWKSISAARTASGRKSRERLASQAEGKADELFELAKAARLEASRLEGIILELKRQISEKEKEKEKEKE